MPYASGVNAMTFLPMPLTICVLVSVDHEWLLSAASAGRLGAFMDALT